MPPRYHARPIFPALLGVLWVAACDNPLPPGLCGSIPEQSIFVGETVTVDFCFDDPNGEMLDFRAFTSDPAVATVAAKANTVTATAVSPGIALVTMVATDPTGLKAQQSFRVVVPNRPPATVGMIDDRELMVGDSVTLDVTGYFSEPDGQALAYAGAVSDSSRLAVTMESAVVTLVAVAKGTVEVAVTATDPGGLAAMQRFQVKVPNRPPVAVDSIVAREIMVDRADTLDVSPFFSDPDEDPLVYMAQVSDSATVAVAVSGSVVTVIGRAKGEAEVTVTATDDEGLFATQRFSVTVPNRPPVVTDSILPRMLFKDKADTLELTAHFNDPDGDALAWGVEASDSSVVAMGLSARTGTLIVTALLQGDAMVTVTATDTEGLSAQQSFAVTVPNRGPVATDTIPSHTLYKREALELDLVRYFDDPDGDALQYETGSTDSLVAAATVTGATLTVTAGAQGEATIAVTATDPGGLSAGQRFAVTVLNRAPTVTAPIPTQTIFIGQPHTLDADLHFTDPDGDTLSYSAVSANRRVVLVRTSGSGVTLSAQRKGTAEVTITATDPDGLAVQHTFGVLVGNREPVPVGTFPDLELASQARLTLPIVRYFRDPDRDVLLYEASTADPGIAQATTRGSSVTLRGVSDGHTTLTLTATDPEGLTATQTSQITVTARSDDTPTPVGTIPAQTVAEGRNRTLVASGYFQDPNGDPLTYSATTEDPGIATASASGTRVALTGVQSGRTTLTVTATDPGGLSTALSTPVTVVAQGHGPVVVAPIPPQALEVDQSRTLSVASHFQDPDGGSLGFDAASSDPGIVTVAASGSDVTLRGISQGNATVTVTATDSDRLSVSHAVSVRVEPKGQAPVAVGSLPGPSLIAGGGTSFDASSYFRDPEGADLSYDAGTSDPTVATASATGSIVTVLGVAPGMTTLTVTATDPGGLSATQSAEMDVSTPPRGPEAVGTVPDETIDDGDQIEIHMAPYFNDPNGNPLSYAAGTSSTGIATVVMKQDTLEVKGRGRGTATITVIAFDPHGRSAVQSFSVTVNRPDTGFHIAFAFASSVGTALEGAILSAGAYWMSILSATEFTDIDVNDTWTCSIFGASFEVDVGYVDDLAIVSAVVDIDGAGGTLAAATGCYRRAGGGDRILGAIVFDGADLGGLGGSDLSQLALHEIAHVLGFGLDFHWDALLQNPSSGIISNPTADTRFTGPLAIAAYTSVGGAGSVPVESGGDDRHWRESVLGLELMTPLLSTGALNPLSAISIQALADIGYSVNASLAQSYTLASLDAAPGIAEEARTIDLGNDVFRGPEVVVDERGNIVRVVPGEHGDGPAAFLRSGDGTARADSTIKVTIDSRR